MVEAESEFPDGYNPSHTHDPDCPIKSCESLSVDMFGACGTSAVCAIEHGPDQELVGHGYLRSARVKRHCTELSLITSAIGSGPLYDLTIEDQLSDRDLEFMEDINNEAEGEIRYAQELPSKINTAQHDDEELFITPSKFDPNYEKVRNLNYGFANLSGPSPDDLYTDKRYESQRLTKISKDGSTLVVVKPFYATNNDFVNDLSYDCDIVVYKRNEDWTRVKSFRGSYTGPDGRRVRFKGANCLDLNHDGTVIVLSSPYVDVETFASSQSFRSRGMASVFTYNSTTEDWDRENLTALGNVQNTNNIKINHVSIDGDGNTLAMHCYWDYGWSVIGIVCAVERGDNSSLPVFDENSFGDGGVGATESLVPFQMSGLRISDFRWGSSGSYGAAILYGSRIRISKDGNRVIFYNPIDRNLSSENEEISAVVDVYDYQGNNDWSKTASLSLPKHRNSRKFVRSGRFQGADRTDIIDLSLSEDGSTIAFAAIDPHDATLESNIFNGKVTTFKFSGGEWVQRDIVPDPSFLLENQSDGLDPIRFGVFVDLTSNGDRILVGKEKSSAIFDLTDVGYGSYSWIKSAEIFPQDRLSEKIKTLEFDNDNDKGQFLVTGSIDGQGDVIELLSFSDQRFIVEVPQTSAFNIRAMNTNQIHVQDNHSIYKIDTAKPIDKLNFDELGTNYLDWKGSVISDSDDKDYKYIFNKPNNSNTVSTNSDAYRTRIQTSLINTYEDFNWSFFVKDAKTLAASLNVESQLIAHGGSASQYAIYFAANRLYFKYKSSNFSSNNKSIDVSNLLEDEWNHVAVNIKGEDGDSKYIEFFINGVLVEQIFVDDFGYHDTSRKHEVYIDPQFGMDDIRYFPRVLVHSEVCKLALHRVNSRCPQYFYYDFIKDVNGVISMEYVSGTYIDIPISQFCTKTVIDDCGNIDCVIDAEIKFCYYRDLPVINPIFGVTASGMSGVGFLESNSPPPHLQIEQAHSREFIGIGRIFTESNFSHNLTHEKIGQAELQTGFVDKYNGEFYDISCSQKLYPSGNVDVSNFTVSDISLPHYAAIDEGVFTGDWKADSTLLSDDTGGYIQLIAPDTKGEFSCSLGMTKTLIEPEETVLRMRLSGPTSTFDSEVPPRYTIKNIKFSDPNGDLVVQYDDIVFVGDSDFDNDVNYTTVVRSAKINNIKDKYKWNLGYPNLEADKGYTLSFDIEAEDLGAEFTAGYDQGFSEDQLGINQFNNSLRISAIEICNSGRNCIYDEHFVTLFAQVADTGRRIEKCFFPTMFPHYTYDSGIWPSVSSIWYANNDSSYSNETIAGTRELARVLRDENPETYVNLNSTGPVENSGKLTLRFGYSVASQQEVTKGSFNSAFNQNINTMWFSPSGSFNTLNKSDVDVDRNFFDVDTITLKVLAKKEIGSRDYSLDIVGYSDDCLLHVTSASGGFLQNTSGVFISDPDANTVAFIGNDGLIAGSVSGFKGSDDLGVSYESLSDEDEYFESSSLNDDGGDHYLIATYPTVDSTQFRWYEIPLKIYDDNVLLGKSTNYSMSSFLERIYLDIYPLPTGASIASAYLCVRYNPQNAVKLATQGGVDISRLPDGRSEGGFYPTSRQSSGDVVINEGSGYGPLSKIENIPQAYQTPSGIKSNYSRRWRGMEGTYVSPFGNGFNFGYTQTLLDYPFISGFYLFEDKSTTISPTVGQLEGTLTTNYSDYHYSHYGWRFLNNDIFNSMLPGFTSDYKTTDWTSLTNGGVNFESDPLYGKISDAFKNIVRISGHNSFIDFGQLDYGDEGGLGLAAYVRFTPDANVSGVGYNLFDSGVLVSKWDAGQDMEFTLAYSGGYLAARAKDAQTGNIKEIYDTVLYSGYQFPLSVIMTYNDEGDNKLKLYTDNEFESNWSVLRASSDSFLMDTNSSTLKIGNCPGSGVGFNMFVSEFGLSSGNIVENETSTPLKVTAQKFLENNRVYWWDSSDSPSSDSYKLWSNLDEDTFNDWYLGAFNRCAFSFEFDSLNSVKGKTSGKDLVNFTINHHGSGYSQYAEITMPHNVDSGVAYHTQIENDFLRFNLSDTTDSFHSTYPRIRKSLPDDYDFTEKALVVETILEHKTDTNNINWEDGSVGPKLIVSLYTKTKEPDYLKTFVSEFSEPNWGLVNRDIHYLEPSSCLIRVDSKFTYDSYCDNSERWALFPYNARLSEFKEKFYSKDIDDMFLQYDVVYPSGPAFQSRIDMFSAHVRAEDAFINGYDSSGAMSLITSGNPSPISGNLNLNLFSASGLEPGASELYPNLSGITLMTLGPLKIEDSGCILFTSGDKTSTESIPLSVFAKETIKDSGFYLVVSGDNRSWTGNSNQPHGLNLVTHGKGLLNVNMPLAMMNNESGIPLGGANMPLFTFGPSGDGYIAMRDTAPLFLLQEQAQAGPNSGSMSLVSAGSKLFNSPYVSNSISLFTFTPSILKESLNLTLFGDNFATTVSSGSMELFLGNYLDSASLDIFWSNNNYGTGIELTDNKIASIPVDDEIRGVDLIGYGSCTGDSPQKAFDEALITDDTVWRPKTCNEGGISRAIATYTNTEAGYSGNYYGIRKYTGLNPSSPYFATLKITTGSTNPIKVPRDWEDWEYGICGPDTIGDCCPDDCTQNINYSGVKLLGDFPYVSGSEDLTQVSGRQEYNEYGRALSIKEDLMAVGSPYHTLVDERGDDIENAGAVFLYRRSKDVAGLKANWLFEDKLTLPSGYRKDYIKRVFQNLICYPTRTAPEFCVSGQKWNIGQEGRELGYSLDVGYNEERETVVVGAPGAAWNRDFDDIFVSGIPALMLVFTDKFSYNKDKMARIHNAAIKYERLYKYFSAPWVFGGSEFQPRIDINVLVCQIIDSDQLDSSAPVNPSESWFHHMYVNNLLDTSDSYDNLVNQMSSGVENKFKEIFPYTSDTLYSGIPPIVGIFGDDTPSTSNKAAYEGALDKFTNFHQTYSYASGVEDLKESTAESGYINKIFSDSFDWYDASVEILDKTLSTGNLIENDALKYISSGVGQEHAKSNAYEFQIPPESGGRVFVFEKEAGKFNLVQEIVSPEEDMMEEEMRDEGDNDLTSLAYGNRFNDRFGHAVSISENSEVVSIGSPYSIEPCLIYERDETENERMYKKVGEWLDLRLSEKKQRYNDLLAVSGAVAAGEQIYLELDQPNKFLIRNDDLFWGGDKINLYKKIFKYDHGDIPYIGTWSFLPHEFAGTSRIGFSTAVSESGNMVAFGAPTDSFNEFDDFNVWGESEDTWASYAQAGAVRVFESRKYTNHNKVVEYTRFGNLDRSVNGPHVSYESMGDFFTPLNIPFEKLPFSEIEIPKDAGLAFIVTPELDAASDEIIDNIKTWLSYGDRTLVLVGNDPIWEQKGIYEKSNDIINKILKKLDSRMTIVPARNEYESLSAGVSLENYNADRYNVTKAHRPEYGHEVYTSSPNIFASGVADIRIDLSQDDLEKLKIYSSCDDKNSRCELPIEHMGDLRSEWESECVILPHGGVEYKTNWPFHFDNPNPAQSCTFYPQVVKPQLPNKAYQDIVPILTAAEYKQRPPIIIPASSGVNEECTTELSGIITTTIRKDTKLYDFSDNQIDSTEFHLFQTTDPVLLSGNYNDFDRDAFFDPEAIKDRNAFMQAEGTSYAVDVPPDTVIVSPESVFATEEVYYNEGVATTSKVIIMASMQAETDFSLGKSQLKPNNKDQNIYFYNNLVMQDCNNAANIDQVGGWTGRDSFTSAFAESSVVKVFQQGGHTLSSGVIYTGDIPSSISTVWIANPVAKPQDVDVRRIKKWMKQGDKKLIITYSNDQEIANHIEYICDELSLNTKPYYSEGNNAYFIKDSNKIADSNSQSIPYDGQFDIVQKIDSDADVFKGCAVGYGFNRIFANTKVEKLAICPLDADPSNDYRISEANFETGFTDYAYIPLKVGSNTRKLVYYLDPLTEKRYNNPHTFWKIDADSKVKFPVTPGSGYRLFINWASETRDEKFDILMNVKGVNFSPEPDDEGNSFIDEGGSRKLSKTVTNEPNVAVVNFRVPDDKEEFEITFDTNEWRKIKAEEFNGGRPLTPRIISMSGCLLPIDVTTQTTTYSKSKKVYITRCSGVPWYIPEQTITFPETFRPISTLNDKYCNPIGDICEGFGGQEIEDGPVVVADELEHFTDFSQGKKRSRIILISDASIVQGDNPFRNDGSSENQEFIRSLYPVSPDKRGREIIEEDTILEGERKFSFTQKVRAPERGSAAKYYAATGLVNQTIRYTLGGVAGNLGNYTDQEDTFNPSDVARRFTPETLAKIKQEIKNFGANSLSKYGMYPRYSGIIDGTLYVDAGVAGGLPDFMKAKGKDYIDFDMLASGYAGDLFGYSIDIHEDKLVVGTPFNAFKGETPVSWSGIKDAYDAADVGSGLQISSQGGAGAAFYFERTGRGVNAVSEFLPWEFKEKIKPNSINEGIDNCTITQLKDQRSHEPVGLSSTFVSAYASNPDRFGYSVGIDSDFIAVGAPMHDFETLHEHIYSGSIIPNGFNTAFIRKEFNSEFDIPQHRYYDLGSSGVRIDQFDRESGKMVLNNGAVYTFRHQMTNFAERRKEWIFAEKLNTQGYSDRNTQASFLSGCENDHFGFSVAIDRAKRGDSDYTLVGGAPRHDFTTSGNHITPKYSDAGSIYTFDAMLRSQTPSIPNDAGYIDAQVFGLKPAQKDARLTNLVYQNSQGSPLSYSVSGLIFTNENGDIFLEVSGYDPAVKGFVAHRPFVESVIGDAVNGTGVNNDLNLVTKGRGVFIDNAWPNTASGLDIDSNYDFNAGSFDSDFDSAKIRPSGMSLYITGPDQADVYNSMSLFTNSWTTNQEGSGIGATPLTLLISGAEPTTVSGIPTLYTSGTAIINAGSGTDPLTLRIRGV